MPEGKYIYRQPGLRARMVRNVKTGSDDRQILARGFEIAANVAPVETEIRESLKQYGKWFGPLTVHRDDGTEVPTEFSITALPDGGTICVSRDNVGKR